MSWLEGLDSSQRLVAVHGGVSGKILARLTPQAPLPAARPVCKQAARWEGQPGGGLLRYTRRRVAAAGGGAGL
jgi:hypothetical protein